MINRVNISVKMHLLQKNLLILMIFVGVSKQSVVELIKTDGPQNVSSLIAKPVDNPVELNSTSHRKGRCKN